MEGEDHGFRMKYRELSFYAFGLKAGLLNLWRNGFQSGRRNTFSYILQPINSYSRFPEFRFLEMALAKKIHELNPIRPAILDIGSPKLLGLYLACHYDADIFLTDISDLNIHPYQKMWQALHSPVKGRVIFQSQDARCLSYPVESFDAVYSMSVLEHIEGERQDEAAVGEMLRVLKPGGILLISVPFGLRYQEQRIRGLAHAVERADRTKTFFFQRIYDQGQMEARILGPARGHQIEIITAYRQYSRALVLYHRLRACLPEKAMAILGFTNPLMSALFNRHRVGMFDSFPRIYGQTHSFGDLYGDLVLKITKKAAP